MSIAKMFEAGRMAAREDQERSALAKHLQPALGGDKVAQQAIYGVAPMRGMEVEGLALQRRQGASEMARKQLADLSTLAARAPQMAAQVYPKWKAALEATGIATGLPEQYEEGAMEAMRAFAQGDEYTLTPGSARFGADGRLIASQPHAPPKPDFQLYDSADGPVWLPKPGAGPMPAATAAPPSGGAASLMGSSFDDAVSHVLKTEGGYVANDAGAGPTNFGINSRANPDVNVASLTPDGAKQLYRERYWDAIGADQLPPQIRMAAFDAAVNQGPQRALEWVRQSGGDPQKFAALRQGHYNGLVQSNPEKYGQYAQGWQNRNQQTAGVTAIPVQGVRPKPKADDKPSALQEKLATARAMGATEDQLRQIVMGESGGGKPSATQIKLANTAKAKLIDLKAMEDQLKQVEAAFKPLRGSFSAGMGGGMVPSVEGKRFDAAVALLKGMARKLTRTPGEGAMSDYESKLAELANPSRGEYEDVTADQITQLRALIDTTRQGYEALLQDAGGNTSNMPGNAPRERAAPRRLKFNPATGRIE